MPFEGLRSRKRIGFAPAWGASLLTFIALAGCSKQPASNSASTASSQALYGAPQGLSAKTIPRMRPMTSETQQWEHASFACLQTELSPATLYHCATKYLGLFNRMADYGLGAPTFAAFNTPTGPKVHTNGEPMNVRWMEENWVLVWFAGAEGWTNWDSPWVVYLQHKPSAMRLDESGLHIEFKETAGDVVLMPLYGYEKAPLPAKDFLAGHGLPSNKIRTWEWRNAIPREPLMRLKYWACATREFPIYCEDSFSVDRARDTVTIRQRFKWHVINDDWKTRHIKVAPVSPPLALASMDKQFPVEFSKAVMDFTLFTPYGPYMGVENVDTFDATFKVLQYINETEAYDPPQATNHPSVQAALDRLRKTAQEKFRRADSYEHDPAESGNSGWAILGHLWYAKGLPYYDEATRTNALAGLRKYFHEEVLVTNRFKLGEFPKDSGRTYYILERPGIGSSGASGDAGKFSADVLETLWAYAHFSGDWELIKERWEMVKKLFCTPAQTRWVSFGRDGIAELGDEAGPCLAMARMAYKVGDLDTYNYACYMFAHELVRRYNDSHLLPSEVQLRSLLLNEAPAQLATLTTPEQFSGPASGVIASCISVLRASHATRYERLIPPGEPSPFVAGLEREVAGPNPYLAQAIQSNAEEGMTGMTWPEVTWWKGWETPTGHRWTFGHVTPVREGAPSKVRAVPLNWNTEALVYVLP